MPATFHIGKYPHLASVVTGTISISVAGDRVAEPDEAFTVTQTGVAQGPATFGQATGAGTIVNND